MNELQSVLGSAEVVMLIYAVCSIGCGGCVLLLGSDVVPRSWSRPIDRLCSLLWYGAVSCFCVAAWKLFWLARELC